MEIIPAIDLRGGKCVRLYQGNFRHETVFSEDPVGMAQRWEELGASRLHIVDLDGVRAGGLVNLEVMRNISKSVRVPIQVGGGIRSSETARQILALGVERVVVGTTAIENPSLVQSILKEFGANALAVGVDVIESRVAIRGWEISSTVLADDLVHRMLRLGVLRFVYTDIGRDGTLEGPNIPGVAAIVAQAGSRVIASGGIASLQHLGDLANLGVEGAIIGRALYTGDLSLEKALSFCK